MLLGQVERTTINLDEMEARLQRPEYAPSGASRCARSACTRRSICSRLTPAGATDFAPWLKDAQINRDRNLRLQYLAGRGLNLYRADAIFAEMVSYAKEPEGIFEGSPDQDAGAAAEDLGSSQWR